MWKDCRVKISYQGTPECGKLFPSQNSYSGGECAAVESAECQETCGANDVVHGIWIVMISDVVETSTQRPVKTQCVKSFF